MCQPSLQGNGEYQGSWLGTLVCAWLWWILMFWVSWWTLISESPRVYLPNHILLLAPPPDPPAAPPSLVWLLSHFCSLLPFLTPLSPPCICPAAGWLHVLSCKGGSTTKPPPNESTALLCAASCQHLCWWVPGLWFHPASSFTGLESLYLKRPPRSSSLTINLSPP